MRALGIIPARLGSARLRAKMLADLEGKPLVVRTWETVRRAKRLERVVVACDDGTIQEAVSRAGGEAVLTSRACDSGTARCQEVAAKWPFDLYVNIQGDEPFMAPEAIDTLVDAMAKDRASEVGTLAVPKQDRASYESPHVVKVVCDKEGAALYFSRAPIPARRDGGIPKFYKHLGIYAYRPSFFQKYPRLERSGLEEAEQLEQLRFLASGIRILVVETTFDSLGIDTEEDLDRARARLRELACPSTSS